MRNRFDSAAVQRLSPEDWPAMEALRREVDPTLTPGFVQERSERDLAVHMDGTQGTAYGVFEAGTLVAMAFLRTPSMAHPNKGEAFPRVADRDWPLHTAFLTNAMVLPSARGKGYQRALIATRLQAAAHAGMRWVCSGVHQANLISWRNLLAQGLAIVGCRVAPDGRAVVGLLAALGDEQLRSYSNDQRLVSAEDWVAHGSALKAGYIGVGFADEGGVRYQRST